MKGDERALILHLITDLDSGGAEWTLYKLLASFSDRDFRHEVVSLTTLGTLGPRIAELGIPVHGVGLGKSLSGILGLFRLYGLLRRRRPRILQTWLYHADLLGVFLAPLAGIPHLVWNLRCAHMDWSRYPMTRRIVGVLARFAHRPDGIIVNSQEGIRVHQGYGYRPRHWQLLENGFDLARFKPDKAAREAFRNDLGIPLDIPLIGLVARFDPMKDHLTFLATAEILIRSVEGVRFLLVGRGMTWENQDLAAMIRSHEQVAERLILLADRPDVERILPALDLFLLTSIGEGFPNVVGEAMACGLPCVVTRVGEAPALVGEEGGRVADVGDAEGLAAACRKVLELGEYERTLLGETARRRIVEHFSLQQVAEKYARYYQQVVAGGDKP